MSGQDDPDATEPPRWQVAERLAQQAERARFPAQAVRVARWQLPPVSSRRTSD